MDHDGDMMDHDVAEVLRSGVARLTARRPPRAAGEPTLDPWTFVATAQLARDAAALASRVPPDVDMVAAVPRSGLLPGSIIAAHLHLPLLACSRQRGLTAVGSGVRLETTPGIGAGPPRHVLVVDDTAARGREMAAAAGAVRAAWPDAQVTRCVIYCHPQARRAVDLCAAVYGGAHYLEWNWPNAGHGAACAYDFDGVLCRDEDPTQPLYLPRRARVPLIVTGRHESARGETLAWLDRWGVRVDQLVMRDFDEPHHIDRHRIAALKAEHYGRSGCVLFAESDEWQAQRINVLTGRAVLCPAAGRVFPPRVPPPADPRPAPTTRDPALLELVRQCPDRSNTGRPCRCTWRCRGTGEIVSLETCLSCVRGD